MNTPALEQLMGAYFHLDWYDEHEDEWLTLQDFLEGEPRLAPLLPGEISHLLDAAHTDVELRDRLYTLGSCYTPADGTTYREWLTAVAVRTQEWLTQPGGEG